MPQPVTGQEENNEQIEEENPGYARLSEIEDLSNGNNTEANGHVETNGENGNRPVALSSSEGRLVTVNGMEFHVYGNLRGLELLHLDGNSANGNSVDTLDSEDEEEEEKLRVEADAALRQANLADDARRSAPISPDQSQAIINAMRGVSIGGYRPEWAEHVPEEDWINRFISFRRTRTSVSDLTTPEN